MRVVNPSDGDQLFRHVIFPLAHNSQKVFVPAKYIRFVQVGQDKLQTSVAWDLFVPNSDLVQAYGCRVAAGMNARAPNAKQKKIYCGAYATTCESLLSITRAVNEVTNVTVRHMPEDGEIAHTDLIVELSNTEFIDGTKTALVDRIWNASRGPLPHVCEEDAALMNHPSSQLEPAPCGQLGDAPGIWRRIWRACQYLTLNALWRLGCSAGKTKLAT